MALFTCVKHCPAFIFASLSLFLEKKKKRKLLLANHCSRTNLNVYAGFIVRSNKRFFVSLPVFVIQLGDLEMVGTANIVT